MKVFFSGIYPEPFDFINGSIFLAGPTLRKNPDFSQSWRCKALTLLTSLNYMGIVFIPELDKSLKWKDWGYINQIAWETSLLQRTRTIMFWIPRDLSILPGFTTNIEFGEYLHSGKIVVGIPPEAVKTKYMQERLRLLNIPCYSTLEDTVKAAILKDSGLDI